MAVWPWTANDFVSPSFWDYARISRSRMSFGNSWKMIGPETCFGSESSSLLGLGQAFSSRDNRYEMLHSRFAARISKDTGYTGVAKKTPTPPLSGVREEDRVTIKLEP
jgi:hypothetical protein